MLGNMTIPDVDPFSLAFGTKTVNFLDVARRNSLVAQHQDLPDPDDLLSPFDIEWDLLQQIAATSHVLTAANITDVESSDSSVCTASTEIFEDDERHQLSGRFSANVEIPRRMDIATLECEQDIDDAASPQYRFKPFHEEKWSVRYRELQIFHRENGHAAVPHTYPKNQQLARWIKRQRRQYKLLEEGKATTLTPERLDLLNSLGFVWDSHEVSWSEKYGALLAFKRNKGDCNVPSNYVDKKLATWVKCQRRQYKLYCDKRSSSMTDARIEALNKLGFLWEIRNVAPRSKGSNFIGGAPFLG